MTSQLQGPSQIPAASHVILAGDFDAAPDSSSIRFWTGRQSLDGISVAYQDAWEAVHPGDAGPAHPRP